MEKKSTGQAKMLSLDLEGDWFRLTTFVLLERSVRHAHDVWCRWRLYQYHIKFLLEILIQNFNLLISDSTLTFTFSMSILYFLIYDIMLSAYVTRIGRQNELLFIVVSIL